MSFKSANTRVDFSGYVPQTLINVNSPTQTLAWETTTQMPIPTGAVQGKRFYMSEALANQLSSATQTCHEGWYRIVQVDSGATAANIAFGYIGAQLSVADGPDVVTDASHVLTLGADPVVFLGAVTPGNWTIVQDAGTATIAVTASQNVAVGDILYSTAAGTADVLATTSTDITALLLTEILAIALASSDSAYVALVPARLQPTFGE
jgi:hypothetical protein